MAFSEADTNLFLSLDIKYHVAENVKNIIKNNLSLMFGRIS